MRRLIATLLLVALALPVSGQIIIRRATAAGGCADTDDFSTDLIGTCWTVHKGGSWSVAGGVLNGSLLTPDASVLIEHDNTRARDVAVVFKFTLFNTQLPWFLVRHNGSGTGYGIWVDDGVEISWRYTTNYCDSGSQIETDAYTGFAAGDYIGLAVTAEGNDTVISYWDFGTSQPGAYSTWGTATGTMTSNPATPVNSAGKVGVCSQGNINSVDLDNFAVEDI